MILSKIQSTRSFLLRLTGLSSFRKRAAFFKITTVYRVVNTCFIERGCRVVTHNVTDDNGERTNELMTSGVMMNTVLPQDYFVLLWPYNISNACSMNIYNILSVLIHIVKVNMWILYREVLVVLYLQYILIAVLITIHV